MDKNPSTATVKTSSSNFTGDAWMNPVFGGDRTSQLTCGFVRFTPGARTNWHSHVNGQLLVCTDGIGLVGTRDGKTVVLRAGESVWTPAGEEHFHGGTAENMMCAGKLGVGQIDLLILHQALPSDFGKTLEAYRALETLLKNGKVRAIGVSNFMVEHLTNLLDEAEVVPAVNQIELHPYFQQPEVQAFNAEHGIVTQAWSPIGGITFYREGEHTSTLEDPAIVKIAESHSKSPAQVMLRWHLQEGRSVIPKSTKPRRITENIDVFDFELTPDEVAAIDGLDTGKRGGPEPDAITLKNFGREIPEA